MTASVGAFGKMPALGDFFRIDLPPGFVDAWDRWLQEAIPAARTALGPRWQDCYFSAPIWRFTLAPGLAGAAPVAGVMMMSVDRVGRQFPLTLARLLPDGQGTAQDHFAAAPVFAALEALALDALDDAMTRDRLAERLAALPAAPPAVAPPLLFHEPGEFVASAPGDMAAALAALAAGTGFDRPSFWSAEVQGASRLLVCEGLPAGGQVLGLFDLAAPLWGLPPAPVAPSPLALRQAAADDGIAEPLAHDAAATLPPAAIAPPADPGDATLPPRPLPPARVFGPDDDPLADILSDAPDLDDLPVATAEDDDPLAAIMSAGDAAPDEPNSAPQQETA